LKVESFKKNKTCKLTKLSKGHKTISIKWVYKTVQARQFN